MKKYYNYSPEIPSGDDLQDDIPDIGPQPEEQVEKPRRRRRPSATAARQTTQKATQARPEPSATPDAPRKNFMESLNDWFHSAGTRMVTGIILGGMALWLGIAFFSYFGNCIADQSVVESLPAGASAGIGNDAGEGGARITEFLINKGFGVGAFVIVVWLLCLSMKLLVGYPRFRTLDFTIKSLIAFITLSVVVGMLSIGLDTDVNWGGLHGRIINEKVYEFIGWTGAIILSVVLIAVFVVICLRDFIKWIMRKKRAYDERRRIEREELEAQRLKEEEVRATERRELEDEARSGEGAPLPPDNEPEGRVKPDDVAFDPESDTIFDLPDLEDLEEDWESTTQIDVDEENRVPDTTPVQEESEVDALSSAEETVAEAVPAEAVEENHESSPVVDASAGETLITEQITSDIKENDTYGIGNVENDNPVVEETSGALKDEEPEEGDVMTVNVNQIEKGGSKSQADSAGSLFTHEYKFPDPSFLVPGKDTISVDAEEQQENNEKIRKTLLDFGIPITSIEATVGPTVTLYEIKPDTGVKIARIRNLVDDIALSLAAKGVRIIAPIPGKGTVGIEVANKEAQMVSMRTIIQSKNYQESKYELPIAMGSTISNDVYIANLAKMPHLLVAGATGQGKSVGLNAIITSLLYSKRPEELKFVMVDPKRVEFSLYSKIENYYLAKIPGSEQAVITKMENVVATLNSLCVEMDERYMLLEKAFVRQVGEYNQKFRDNKLSPAEGHRFMPYIVVIIDEFADLIMTAGKEVELPIARLAQLARAVGIHVIIATQRPSTNVITGMIKANFPVRIAFKVSSGVDSKTILDSTGAQQLIGRGDMLISNNGEMTRVQCAFVDTPEVEEICDYISRQPYPQGPYLLPEPQMSSEGEASELTPANMGKKDPLLEDVARDVVMEGVASTSAVQRRYEIGYNRAGRIMDQLEALGIVGPASGGKPRNVLVDFMSLEDILGNLGGKKE